VIFRSPGLRRATNIFAFIGYRDRLIGKLPYARASALIADGSVESVTMGTRTIREWVAIPTDTDYDAAFANCPLPPEKHSNRRASPRDEDERRATSDEPSHIRAPQVCPSVRR
jgi:hypothetical protein